MVLGFKGYLPDKDGSGLVRERIGFIGLGAMGLPMVRNILKSGYSVTVYDIVADKINEAAAAGAGPAASCKAVAEQSDIVISIVPAAAHVKAAMLGRDGVIEGIAPGSTVIEMSTIDPATAGEVALALASKRVDLLAAPVVRGVKGAISGTLSIYVGGDFAVFERCKPLLSTMGTDIEYCGGVGTGNTVKLVNNMIVGITMCALSEALVLGVKAGVRPDVLFSSLSKGSANSFVLQNHVKNHVLTGDFSEGMFSIDYEMKDLDLALSTADHLHVQQQFCSLAYQTYQQARALGLSKQYYPAVIEVFERSAGVKVRASVG
jgi:3-hydroxyisobutyrate dehydrogenase-like beta-hydroxyacid dehydrogenase